MGAPTKPKRGLGPGDPLAPFLFLIVTKGLAVLVREATRIGVLEGVRLDQKGMEVSLLQFAYDTLFVCKPKYQSILAIKVILRCFEVVLGLKFNFYKSQVGAVGILVVGMNIFLNA